MRLREISSGDVSSREGVLSALPFRGRGMELPGLARAAGWKGAFLGLDGIRQASREAPFRATVVALASGGVRSVLLLERGLAWSLVDGVLGRPATVGRDALSSGEEGALYFALDKAGGDWIDAGGPPFEVRGLLADHAQIALYSPDATVLVSGSIASDAGRWRLAFLGSTPAPCPRATFARPEVPLSRAAHWPLAAKVVAGHTRLRANEIRDIAPGDAVTLDACAHPLSLASAARPFLDVGGVRFAAAWVDESALELVSSDEGSSIMEKEREAEVTLSTGALGGGARFQVPLQAVVGRATMTVEEALGLTPGRVVRLDSPVGTSVRLMSGDSIVAAGELVEVEGAFAVEITEVP